MDEYTNQRLEDLLSAAIDHSVPDLRERCAETPVTPLEAPDGIVPAQGTRRPSSLRRTAIGLAACLALVLGLSSFAFFSTQSVIGIDVNPSIELTANCFDRVLSVRALNEDAVNVIGDMDLKYVDLDIAVNALVGSMALHGYFESGQDVAVLVSVEGGSERRNQALQEKLASDIRSAAVTVGARASVYTQNADAPVTPPAPVLPATPTPSATPSSTPAPPDVPVGNGALVVPSAPAFTQPPVSSPPSPVASPSPATARERAAYNGISYGKQVFIDKLLTLAPTLDEQELANMAIGKIASLAKRQGLDISAIVDYDPDDSVKENIEDFIDDLDDPDDHDGRDSDDDDDDDDDKKDDHARRDRDGEDDDDEDDD